MRAAVSFLLLPFTVGAAIPWSGVLKQDATWYSSAEAHDIAESVMLYQTPSGGWPKNTDMTRPPSADFLARTEPDHRAATFDNGATTTQLQFLARVQAVRPDPHLQSAIERGIDYLIEAQSPSGGWPQYFPRRPGYYSHITYNDDAMVNVLTVLRSISRADPPFDNVEPGEPHPRRICHRPRHRLHSPHANCARWKTHRVVCPARRVDARSGLGSQL